LTSCQAFLPPEWTKLWVDETNVTNTAIEDSKELSFSELRGFFEKEIIDGYHIDQLFLGDA
jgi:hypothetical protein